jgi:hypothetical protein
MPGNMIIRLLWAAGIRTVAINRRGHTPDQPLKAPRWNLFGDVDDLEQVYWHVKKNLIGEEGWAEGPGKVTVNILPIASQHTNYAIQEETFSALASLAPSILARRYAPLSNTPQPPRLASLRPS